jgi:hypothetical protein
MPVAVVQSETERFDLKSAPPDGFVLIRRMSYGERLTRNGNQTKMKIMSDKKSQYAGEIDMAIEAIAHWDFANLIVEHNLQDADGRVLNFKNPVDVRKLAANVGEEIGSYIDKINSFEDVEEGN